MWPRKLACFASFRIRWRTCRVSFGSRFGFATYMTPIVLLFKLRLSSKHCSRNAACASRAFQRTVLHERRRTHRGCTSPKVGVLLRRSPFFANCYCREAHLTAALFSERGEVFGALREPIGGVLRHGLLTFPRKVSRANVDALFSRTKGPSAMTLTILSASCTTCVGLHFSQNVSALLRNASSSCWTRFPRKVTAAKVFCAGGGDVVEHAVQFAQLRDCRPTTTWSCRDVLCFVSALAS